MRIVSTTPKCISIFSMVLAAAGDKTPITTRVLKAWMTYRQIGDHDSTAALMTELAASRDAKSADLVAIVAADELANDGVARPPRSPPRCRLSAASPLSERRRYQLVLLVNNFMKEKRNASKRLNTYSDVVRLDDLLFRDAFHPANRPMRDDLLKVHDETWAWRIALDSVLSSSGQGMTEFTTSHDENRRFEFLEQPADKEVAVLPPCPGTLTGTDDITYPYRASVEMIVAAVVYQFRVDAEGKVADLNILASAPSEGGFSEAVIESAKNWRYVPDEGVDTQTCTMASPMRVGSYQFLLKHREYIDKKKKR
ncbi:MAG: TonB family protein [Hyphomonadaceae bacterium]